MDHAAGAMDPGTRRAFPVKGKVIHRFILPDVFTFGVGNVIFIIEIECRIVI